MRSLACLLTLVIGISLYSQQPAIIPQPVSVKQPRIAVNFTINSNTLIVLEGSGLEKVASFLSDYLARYYSLHLKVVKQSSSLNTIRLNYERMDNETPGAYSLTVNNKGVYIAGDNETGVFYGMQTLIQLLPSSKAKMTPGRTENLNIAYINIEDAPRFEYRGLHLDVGRHFMPVDFIKKYIDYIALHKMNYFHWHLTEDQGWRIEIKKYPNLTKVGAWRNGTIIGRYPGTGNDNMQYGGYYTQEQIKDIVKYASDRYITVVPEIELPGHGSAAIAAYPSLSCFPDEPTKIPANMISQTSSLRQAQGDKKLVQETWGVFDDVFCAGKDETFTFLQDVMDEVLALFPSQYIHVGGDECPKSNWKRCPNCQKRMKDHNLKDEHELQSYFIQRMEKYLNAKGRTLIGWDEILEGGLAPNAMVMSWRGEEGGIAAAKQKHKVIMTPGNPVYFDHTQSENEDSVTIGGFNPIEKVYAYEPVPKELNAEEGKYVLGAQANLWTEYMKNPMKVEYMLFPRISALSEVLWSPKEKKNWNDFEKRLQVQFDRYKYLWNVNYSRAYFDLRASVIPSPDQNGILWKLESKNKEGKIKVKSSLRKDPLIYVSPINIISNGAFEAVLTDKSGQAEISNPIKQVFSFSKSTGKKISLTNPISSKYPGDGAFTLVNGIINSKGLARSKEFIGFEGTDCEAIIDLGKEEIISSFKINFFEQKGSWIYAPASMEVWYSNDGKNFTTAPNAESTKDDASKPKRDYTWWFHPSFKARYLKVLIKNYGLIPEGQPGAGHKAWLFVDEIEVN